MKKNLRVWLVVLLLAVLFINKSISLVSVRGRSMQPTVEPGQTVVIQKVFYSLHPKDIILFRDPEGELSLKRISLIEGDNIYVLGDNQDVSIDSLEFGAISRSNIIGKLMFPLTKDYVVPSISP